MRGEPNVQNEKTLSYPSLDEVACVVLYGPSQYTKSFKIDRMCKINSSYKYLGL